MSAAFSEDRPWPCLGRRRCQPVLARSLFRRMRGVPTAPICCPPGPITTIQHKHESRISPTILLRTCTSCTRTQASGIKVALAPHRSPRVRDVHLVPLVLFHRPRYHQQLQQPNAFNHKHQRPSPSDTCLTHSRATCGHVGLDSLPQALLSRHLVRIVSL
jgi:hypothetical protein